MKSLKKKIVLIALICLSVLIGSFGGIVFARNRAKLYALNGVELTVAKVRLYTPDNENYYALHYNYKEYTGTSFGTGTYYTYNRQSNAYEIDSNPSTDSGKTYYTRNAELYAELIDFENTRSNPFLNIENSKTVFVDKSNAYEGTFVQELTDDDNVFMLKNAELEKTEDLTVRIGNESKNIAYYQKEFMLVQFKSVEETSSKFLKVIEKGN